MQNRRKYSPHLTSGRRLFNTCMETMPISPHGAHFMIQKINDRISIFFTDEPFGRSNAVLIDDDVRIMIDSGAGKILKQARPEDIDILINSHCHIDHVWDNSLFVRAQILAHPLERENFRDHTKIGSIEKWKSCMKEDLDEILQLMGSVIPTFLGEWRIDGTIVEGDVIVAGKTKISVLHTPGHTSGHLVFFFPEEGLLFSGDICLTKVGPWYGDTSTPVDDFISSINRIIDLKPDRVVSGHNKEVLPSSSVRKVFEEYRERIYRREGRIFKSLKEAPSTLDELAAQKLIYPAHPSILVVYWEKSMIMKHLDRLIKIGAAAVDEDGRYCAI